MEEQLDLPDGSDEEIFLMKMCEAPDSVLTDELSSTEASDSSADH